MSTNRLIAIFLAVPGVIIAACVIFWLRAINSPNAHISVRNQSGIVLSNLTISGACEHRHADTVGDSLEWQTATAYHKGGPILFSFSNGTKRYGASPQIYSNYSGFCGITLTVRSNMTIESEVRY